MYVQQKCVCSPNVDQAKARMTTINRIANSIVELLARRINRQINNAISSGRTQQPRTQTLWKKDLKKNKTKLEGRIKE